MSLASFVDRAPVTGPEATVVIWTTSAVITLPGRGGYYLPAIIVAAIACAAFAFGGVIEARSRLRWAFAGADTDTRVFRLLVTFSACLCFLGGAFPPLTFIERPAVDLVINATTLATGAALAWMALGTWSGRFLPERLSPWIALCIALLVLNRVLVIVASPTPWCDAWTLQQEAVDVLLSGANPYAHDYQQIYSAGHLGYRSHFGYLPMVVLWGTPFKLIFGDVRAGYIVAEIAAITATFVIASGPSSTPARRATAFAIALAYLANPLGPFIIEQGWSEPLVFFCTSLAVIAVSGVARGSGLAVGLAAVAKQTNALLLPLAIAKRDWRRTLFTTLLIPVALLAPFVAWGPDEFVRSTLTGLASIPPRADSFSLWTVVHQVTGVQLPGVVTIVAVLVAWVPALLFAARRRPHAALAAIVLAFWVLFLTARQSFANYHFFVSGLLCLFVASGVSSLRHESRG